MSLEGKLIADFSSVPSEAEKAIAALGRMETGATKVATSLDRIKPTGGLVRVAQDAPLAAQALTGLTASLGQFDSALAAVGVHIGPEVRAIGEIGSAATAGAGEIGALGVAGLALGAGIAGWKVGRAAADFFDLDTKIGDATAKLLGWGDVAAQKAAAGQDVLAKASKEVGFQVLSMTTALAINSAALADNAAAALAANAAIARLDAPQRSAEALAKWRGELDQLKSAGLVASLSADIKSQAFSVADLAKNYAVSVGAIAAFRREEEATSAAVHASNAQIIKDTQAKLDMENRNKAFVAARKAEDAAHRKALDDEAAGASAAAESAHAMGIAFDEAQSQAKRKTDEATAALAAEKKAADDVARSMGNAIEFDLSTPEGMAQFKRLNPGASVNAPAGYFDTHSLADAVRDGLVNFYSHYSTQPGERSGAVPAPLVSGGFGSRGAQLVGPSVPVNVQVNVNGVFDPSSKAKLSEAVGSGFARGVSTGRLH